MTLHWRVPVVCGFRCLQGDWAAGPASADRWAASSQTAGPSESLTEQVLCRHQGGICNVGEGEVLKFIGKTLNFKTKLFKTKVHLWHSKSDRCLHCWFYCLPGVRAALRHSRHCWRSRGASTSYSQGIKKKTPHWRVLCPQMTSDDLYIKQAWVLRVNPNIQRIGRVWTDRFSRLLLSHV